MSKFLFGRFFAKLSASAHNGLIMKLPNDVFRGHSMLGQADVTRHFDPLCLSPSCPIMRFFSVSCVL